MLVLKKFLIITMLRVRDDELEHNIWYHELKRSELIPEDDSFKEFFGGDFYKNLNNVLEAEDLDSLLSFSKINMNLFTFIKDVVYSYNVFLRSNNVKEDFLISDRGWACYRGPMGVKKLNAMLNMLEIRYDPYIDMLLHMSSPQDYSIYPLSSSLALLEVSPAFQICLPSAHYNIIYPDEAPSLSSCLGFGSAKTITPPTHNYHRDGTKEYQYSIQQISKKDVGFLNSLFIKNTNRYIGFADFEKVKYSLNTSDIYV